MQSYLNQFNLDQHKFSLTNQEFFDLDQELALYEQKFLNPAIAANLISKNELFTSFAISKAEDSNLTLPQAKNIYKLVKNNKEWNHISQKLAQKQPLTQGDHDKLEYYNILTTFTQLNQQPFSLEELNLELLEQLHAQLTAGLDVFADHIFGFELYQSGQLRKNDQIRVGDYQPALAAQLPQALEELIVWLKNDFTVHNVAIFHNALYALHPFNNGNKRLCRVVEHVLFRLLGLNARNTYSTSYYYHQFKPQYYKFLMASLLKKDLTIFSNFIIQALALSIIDVYKTSIEFARKQFLSSQAEDDKQYGVLKPLIKNKTLTYSSLYKRVRRKMSEQSFNVELKSAVESGFLKRKKSGRSVFYSFDLDLAEEDLYQAKLRFLESNLGKVPEEFML